MGSEMCIRDREKGAIEGFIEKLKVFYEAIPYDISNRIRNKEQYYQSIGYCVMRLLSLQVESEIATARGRIDLVVKTRERIYVIELKINSQPEDALRQIEEKSYPDRYRQENKKIYLIGIGFDTEKRNISGYKVREL